MGARALGLLRLALLALLGAYNLATFHDVAVGYGEEREVPQMASLPKALRQSWLTPTQAWPAKWRMFTFFDHKQVFVDFEGWDGTRWVRLPMERWFPARWDSGFRWDKGNINSSGARRGWLNEACKHANEEAADGAKADAPAITKVRANTVTWEKTPGKQWQPQKNPGSKSLGEVTCRR